jgi:hypothetical protein
MGFGYTNRLLCLEGSSERFLLKRSSSCENSSILVKTRSTTGVSVAFPQKSDSREDSRLGFVCSLAKRYLLLPIEAAEQKEASNRSAHSVGATKKRKLHGGARNFTSQLDQKFMLQIIK